MQHQWIAQSGVPVDPYTGSVYLTLTNNTARTSETNAANPRLNNKFGHVIRWDEGETATDFIGYFRDSVHLPTGRCRHQPFWPHGYEPVC
ncbi:DUF839 domain-containing protein [Vibrio lentus]|nr:DUF839 domain-containing protein [Vibrio lentus]